MLTARYLNAVAWLAFFAFAPSSEAIQPICTLIAQPWQPLQNVIESAPPGAVLCLAAGVWTHGVSLHDKVLTLWGAGPDQTIVMGAGDTDGISVFGQSLVTVRGLGIYNFRDGMVVSGQSHVSIRDLQLSNNSRAGLHVLGLADATLENSLVSYNLDGVAGEESAQVTVQYSQIVSNQRDGIRLDFASLAWLIGNIIQNNERYGVRVYSLENLFVCWRNVVTNNKAGDFYPEMAAYKCW
ncbi:MAG: right-handed parallel beta-helix repeat-containing protein [Candidatus Bipolaricaulia bacterium]